MERAVRLVDDEGLPELTVRRLAQALGTGSASLYRHVASRDELLVLMVDHVIGEVDLGAGRLAGRPRAQWLAHELRRVLVAHRQLLPALTAAPLLGPNALAGIDAGLAAFAEMGLTPSAVVPACLALVDFVLGAVYFETGRGAAEMQLAIGDAGRAGERSGEDQPAVGEPADDQPVDDHPVDDRPVDDHPALVAHRRDLARITAEETFAFGLRAFLGGLADW